MTRGRFECYWWFQFRAVRAISRSRPEPAAHAQVTRGIMLARINLRNAAASV